MPSNPSLKVENKILEFGASFEQVPIYMAAGCGKKIPLYKTLVTNDCANNCLYCMFRNDRKTQRKTSTPEEIADNAIKLRNNKRIKGVFLSSSIPREPEQATQKIIETAKLLRKRGYRDYIHLRLMPGCSRENIHEAVELADRVGINFEAPNKDVLETICPDEDFKYDLKRRQRWISMEVRKHGGKSCDTQFVVGAAQDLDSDYLRLTERLYTKYGLRRVYFSGFHPIEETPLAARAPERSRRVLRLYQASFLFRDYGMGLKDLFFEDGRLDLNRDPKEVFAQRNEISVDINEASFRELILVPGIGPNLARKIMDLRPLKSVRWLPRKSWEYLGGCGRQSRLADFKDAVEI